MSVKQHINASRTITGIFELVNYAGLIIFLLAAAFAAAGGEVPASFGCIVFAAIWWFFNKLFYVGLQLLTDITELLHKQQTA